MIKGHALAVCLVLSVPAAACGDGGRASAEAALKATEGTFATVRSDALRYVPDQVKAVEDSIAGIRDSFAKGSYRQVLADAEALMPRLSALGAAAAAKKAEMANGWEAVSGGLPDVIQAIQSRVDVLAKSRRMPPGLTREAFDGAKSGLDVVNRVWTEANEAFMAGNLADAMAKAATVKTRAAEVMTALNMQVPAALK
jgi:hypothetical protein